MYRPLIINSIDNTTLRIRRIGQLLHDRRSLVLVEHRKIVNLQLQIKPMTRHSVGTHYHSRKRNSRQTHLIIPQSFASPSAEDTSDRGLICRCRSMLSLTVVHSTG